MRARFLITAVLVLVGSFLAAIANAEMTLQQSAEQRQQEKAERKKQKQQAAEQQDKAARKQQKQQQAAEQQQLKQQRKAERKQQQAQEQAQQQQQKQQQKAEHKQQAQREQQQRQQQKAERSQQSTAAQRESAEKRERQEHQQRGDQYRAQRETHDRIYEQRRRMLERQRRVAQLHYNERYLEHIHNDRLRLEGWRYVYSPPTYRYYRSGRYYFASEYAADMLRRAVRLGYEEGVRAGQSDREDHWGFGYADCYAYQDATFGYDGYYVSLDEYRHYFRQGFRRGYEDGYYGRWRYGSYSNGVFSLLGNVLVQILRLQTIGPVD